MQGIVEGTGIDLMMNGGLNVVQLLAAESWISETLDSILSWFSFDIAYQVYLVIGIASITVMFFWMIMNVLGFGSGTDAMDAMDAADALDGADAADAMDAVDGMDAADAADAGEGADSNASVFTFRSILAFFGGFGWSGVLAMENGMTASSSFLVSIPVGLFFFLLAYGMLLFLITMSASGSLDYKNAIGETGEVYLSIPPNRSGSGKVRVKVQGRLKTVSAYNASDKEAETHSRVRVIDQIDSSTLLVKPLSEVDNDSNQNRTSSSDESSDDRDRSNRKSSPDESSEDEQ